MAINVSSKFLSTVEQIFTHESYVKPKFSAKMDFTGAKTVKVYRLLTMDEADYTRGGSNRYGVPADVQDIVDEYTMSQDKAFTGVVDKGDESDQAISNKAGQWLRAQLKERSTPAADKYAFARMAALGDVLTASAKPTKTTIVGYFADAQEHFTDAQVPDEGRFAFVTAEMFKLIAQSDEFIKLEKLGSESIGRGHVGQLFGFDVVTVPTRFLPANVYVQFCHKSAGAMPYKISETKIHKDPPGISGALIEGRHYYDFFVLAEKACAMLSLVLASAQQAAVALAKSGSTVTATSSGGTIVYTTDGSDPRFSSTAKVYTAAISGLSEGDVVKAYATADGKVHSAVAEFTFE